MKNIVMISLILLLLSSPALAYAATLDDVVTKLDEINYTCRALCIIAGSILIFLSFIQFGKGRKNV